MSTDLFLSEASVDSEFEFHGLETAEDINTSSSPTCGRQSLYGRTRGTRWGQISQIGTTICALRCSASMCYVRDTGSNCDTFMSSQKGAAGKKAFGVGFADIRLRRCCFHLCLDNLEKQAAKKPSRKGFREPLEGRRMNVRGGSKHSRALPTASMSILDFSNHYSKPCPEPYWYSGIAVSRKTGG